MLELGGAQQNTLYTAGNLDKGRFETALVCGKGGMLDSEAAELRIRTHFIPHLIRPVNPVRDTLALIQLFSLFRREKPDIVHTHSSKAGILGRTAAFLARVPVIIHSFHGFGFNRRQPLAVRLSYQLAERLCAALSGCLIFVSKTNMEDAGSLGIGNPSLYRIIRSGIPLQNYPAKNVDAAAKRKELGLAPEGPLIVSVGNLKPQKNPADFVRVAEIVLKSHPRACFLFIGDGTLRGEMEKMISRAGISGRCVFAGWRKDIAEILSISGIFVLTSLWEGLPRSLVEALKSGLPAVCYATDGVKDLLSDGVNGFMTEQKDFRSMAGKISQLLRDENLRAGLALGASRTDLKDFDIKAMVRSQEKLYEELLRRQKATEG